MIYETFDRAIRNVDLLVVSVEILEVYNQAAIIGFDMVRIVSLSFVLLFVSTFVPSLSGLYSGNIQSHRKGYSSHRKKRSISGIIASILKGSKLVADTERYKWYVKSGGENQAMEDFHALGPAKTRGIQSTFWHFGRNQDTSFLLKKEEKTVTLLIWTYSKLPNGRKIRVMDKIKYTE